MLLYFINICRLVFIFKNKHHKKDWIFFKYRLKWQLCHIEKKDESSKGYWGLIICTLLFCLTWKWNTRTVFIVEKLLIFIFIFYLILKAFNFFSVIFKKKKKTLATVIMVKHTKRHIKSTSHKTLLLLNTVF